MAKKLEFKNLYILAFSIILICVYFSTRVLEGFQPTNSAIPNSKTIDSLLESINTPEWFTPARHATYINNKTLYNSKKGNALLTLPYNTLTMNTFNSSKAAGDKDDITFDKLMAAQTKYLSSFDNNSSVIEIIYNVPLYIQLAVGAALIAGIIAYKVY